MEPDGVTPKIDPKTGQPMIDFEPYDPRGAPDGERHFDRVFRHLKTGELDAASRLVAEDATFAKETGRTEVVDDVAVPASSSGGKSAKGAVPEYPTISRMQSLRKNSNPEQLKSAR